MAPEAFEARVAEDIGRLEAWGLVVQAACSHIWESEQRAVVVAVGPVLEGYGTPGRSHLEAHVYRADMDPASNGLEYDAYVFGRPRFGTDYEESHNGRPCRSGERVVVRGDRAVIDLKLGRQRKVTHIEVPLGSSLLGQAKAEEK